MSTTPETEFDLEKLFLPAWAQEAPNVNKYASFPGEVRREGRDFDRSGGRRPPRREGARGPRPAGAPGAGRFQGQGQGRGGDRPDRRRAPQGEAPRREPPQPLPKIDVSILPDDKGTESLARQIRITGRAYPLFEIAHLILQKPERQQVRFDVIKKKGGEVEQPLFLCALDDSLWLSDAEAVNHVLTKHFDTFYKAERTPTDPPKGTYTFVAQCGMSGVVLGPPNYHDYQNQLHRLHNERFSNMPFEAFKARVKIVRDEAVVKKWVEDQSFKTEYICLNVPEPKTLPSREEVEKHFREVHMPNIIKAVESHTVSGPAARQIRSTGLSRLLRSAWEDQRRFPLKLATTLSQQFAGHGLQFFKVNKTVTHVSVARPHYLDMDATPVSEGVKRIVDFINATPKCTRRKLMETLAPAPAPASVPSPAPAPASAPADAAAASAAPAASPEAQATPEQAAVTADLHWLVHQGHVIEFANGVLETAKKPAPKPPKPEPKAPEAASTAAPATSEAPTPAALSEEATAPAPAAPVIETASANPAAPTAAPAAEPAPAEPEAPAPGQGAV